MFQQESQGLARLLTKDELFFYTVHNDRASPFKIALHFIFPWVHCFRIRKLIQKHQIKIVHVHNDFPMLTSWIFRALRGMGCIRVQTLHNYRQWCANGIFFRTKKGICRDCVEKKSRFFSVIYRCYRNSALQSLLVAVVYRVQDFFNLKNDVDVFFCLSQHQKKELISLGVNEKKLILKPNLVPQKKGEVPLSFSEKEIDIIFVGRLEESKGIFKVLDTIDSNTRKKIVVVGYSEVLSELKDRYPEVRFLGKKSHDEVTELIKRSRFLIQPSLWYETFGLTMIEAMSQGTPVLGFPIGTRLDFIQPGSNGFLIQEDNIQEGVNGALKTADYESLQSHAVEFARTFSEERVLKQQLAIYEELLKHGHS